MEEDDWTHPPTYLELQPNQVDVWRVSLDLMPASHQWADSTLSVDETERAARFHFEKDRRRFVIAYVYLRKILSRYLRCEPEQIGFSTNKYGKPVLTTNPKLEFNISHSGDFVLITIAQGRKVGVDVEHMRMELDHE